MKMVDAPRRCLVVVEHLSHYREGVYRALEKSEGWEFSFIGGEYTRDGSIPGIPEHSLRRQYMARNRWLFGRALWQWKALRMAVTGRFSAVIFLGNAAFLSTWVGALLLLPRKTRVHFWTTGWHRPDSNRLKLAVRKLFYSLADSLLLYGEDGYQIAATAGVPRQKMTVVGNSFSYTRGQSRDLSSRVEGLESSLPDRDTINVGAVIRLNPVKRLDHLVRAVGLLRAEGVEVGVLLGGDGPQREELEQLASSLEVPLVVTGAVHHPEDVALLYERLSLTVIPEFAGLTTIQSMSNGIPVVSIDEPDLQAPEYRAIRHGETGVLYSQRGVPGVVQGIRDGLLLVAEGGDRVKASCRAEAEDNWSPEAHAQRILRALEKQAD